MKRFWITAGVLLVLTSMYSTWRQNCSSDSCVFTEAAFGWPVFLTAPYHPESPQSPEFRLMPFIFNVLWNAFAAVSLWAVIRTGDRWRRRSRTEPPL